MRLERHLRNWKKLKDQWDELDVGANDVPLDQDGHGVGDIPDARAADGHQHSASAATVTIGSPGGSTAENARSRISPATERHPTQ